MLSTLVSHAYVAVAASQLGGPMSPSGQDLRGGPFRVVGRESATESRRFTGRFTASFRQRRLLTVAPRGHASRNTVVVILKRGLEYATRTVGETSTLDLWQT